MQNRCAKTRNYRLFYGIKEHTNRSEVQKNVYKNIKKNDNFVDNSIFLTKFVSKFIFNVQKQ
jgi:hypothetical protein